MFGRDRAGELDVGTPGSAGNADAQRPDRRASGDVAKVGEDGRHDTTPNDADDALLDRELGNRDGSPRGDVEREEGEDGDDNADDHHRSSLNYAAGVPVSTRAFFDDAAKAAVTAAIKRIETQTSAEIVVAVRRQAGTSYRDVDFGFGALVAFASLAVLLFVDREFATTWIPVDVAVTFAVGTVLCRYTASLRRLLVLPSRRQAEAHRAACTAFVEMGIGRTSGRNGILVLVALFEHKVAVVADTGVDRALLAPVIPRLEASVGHAIPSFDAFVAALESLGPALAAAMPRRADDVNELSDDVGVG